VFSLSLRDAELLLTELGIVVSYEPIRRWYGKFGASFACKMRRQREVLPNVERRQRRYLNNRVENLRRSTRRRER
jgi:transposase-like protein